MPYTLKLQCRGCSNKLLDDRHPVLFCGKCINRKEPKKILFNRGRKGIKTSGHSIDRVCYLCTKTFACPRSMMFADNIICPKCKERRSPKQDCLECIRPFNPMTRNQVTCSKECKDKRRLKLQRINYAKYRNQDK